MLGSIVETESMSFGWWSDVEQYCGDCESMSFGWVGDVLWYCGDCESEFWAVG